MSAAQIPQYILDALTATGEFSSVGAAATTRAASGLASASIIQGIFDTPFGGQVYESSLADEYTYPNALHQLTDSVAIRIAGYDSGRVDTYDVTCRMDSSDPAQLQTAVEAAFVNMAASTSGVELTNLAMSVEQTEKNLLVYLAHLEITVTSAAAGSAIPAAVVVPLGSDYNHDTVPNVVRQHGVTRYMVLIFAKQADIDAVIDATTQALIGLQDPASGWQYPVQLVSVKPQDVTGLGVWGITIMTEKQERQS